MSDRRMSLQKKATENTEGTELSRQKPVDF